MCKNERFWSTLKKRVLPKRASSSSYLQEWTILLSGVIVKETANCKIQVEIKTKNKNTNWAKSLESKYVLYAQSKSAKINLLYVSKIQTEGLEVSRYISNFNCFISANYKTLHLIVYESVLWS